MPGIRAIPLRIPGILSGAVFLILFGFFFLLCLLGSLFRFFLFSLFLLSLPLFFLLTYEKNAASAQDYAFIYGQIVPFDQLAPYEVYTDDTYVCYEISPFLYTDLDRYLQDFAKEHPEIDLDETTMEQTKQIYQYYRDNLPDLIYFK